MERRIRFTKMHGAGNDYIYVDTQRFSVPDPQLAAQVWSAPHTGISSDGLVLIGAPTEEGADFSMRIFNADGSEALMCGNASRCIGRYLYEKGLCSKREIRLQTLSGIKVLRLDVKEERVESVRVDMLEPKFVCPSQYLTDAQEPEERTLHVDGTDFRGLFVSMGNPHFVVFADHAEKVDIYRFGPLLEHHAAFPQRCNIELAERIDGSNVRVRVWERGSGVTLACGTGACATAAAMAQTGRTGRRVNILMDGGRLNVEWADNNHLFLAGPAEFVFEGEISLP